MKIVHASPGYGSMLTEEQTTKFLTDKKLNLLLGTVDKNGDPFIHPGIVLGNYFLSKIPVILAKWSLFSIWYTKVFYKN